jgi:hypothetical protein
MPDFTFNPRTGRYHEVNGRFVSDTQVRSGVDAAVDLAADRMGDAAARLRAGAITVEQFQAEMFAHVKDIHVATALAAYGGREQMTPERWGYVGSRIRAEYGYVRQMVSDIIDGKQPMTRALDARARSYAAAGRLTYEAVNAREAKARGQTEERNVLHAAESCGQCSSLAALGWVSLGTLPMVGARQCGRHCRCTVSRRAGAASEAA